MHFVLDLFTREARATGRRIFFTSLAHKQTCATQTTAFRLRRIYMHAWTGLHAGTKKKKESDKPHTNPVCQNP